MWLLGETSSLNNDGVRLFEEGRFLEAVDYFQLCLDQVLEIDQQHEDENENLISAGEDANVSAAMTTSTTTTATIVIESSSSNPFHGWSKPFKQPEKEADRPFLLLRVLRIRHQEQESTNDRYLHSHKAALYCNLAVTLHQVLLLRRQPRDYGVVVDDPPAFASSTSITAMMLFRYYEAAYLEYQEATSSSSTDDDDENTHIHHHALLCLALFNNMGVVFLSEIAQFQQASECFKAACGVMCGLMKETNGDDDDDDDDDDNCSEVLEGEEVYEISLNGFLVPSEACPAA